MDKVKVVTLVLQSVAHSLQLPFDLSYNRYELAPSRYGFSGFSILHEKMPMQGEINPKSGVNGEFSPPLNKPAIGCI
jgi:hypothetical protein